MFQPPKPIQKLIDNVAIAVKGQSQIIELAIICMLAEGHILVEDVPGVGKTTLARAFARSLDLPMQRIQFTSDLLPSDITGVSVYDANLSKFQFHKGPLFTNFLLADEINRAEPRAQSALLEAMNEKQVSIDSQCYPLPRPFMVFATQNPLDFFGTFPLPESQLDRFMFRISMGYPAKNIERELLRGQKRTNVIENIQPVLTAEEFNEMADELDNIYIKDEIIDDILNIADATRHSTELELGVSTRTCLDLTKAAKARAFCHGRKFVIPDDVRNLAIPAFAHRIRRSHNATLASTEEILINILAQIPIPE